MEAKLKIAAVADKVNRIQHNRMLLLKDLLKPDISINVFVPDDKPSFNGYDLVYYTHFSLFKKAPCKGKKYASITSHKCLDDMKSTLNDIKEFDAISVNNTILYSVFENRVENLFLTPNGVDTKFFTYVTKPLGNPPVFGWVGNKDRATKNYEEIVVPLSKQIEIKQVAPSKSDRSEDLLSAEEMREFYHSLDFFLVTSSTEGTPNPGLEALSCGVPVITTHVGNMIEIIREGQNGFYAEPTLQSFREITRSVQKMQWGLYSDMREEARLSVETVWDWTHAANYWRIFFLH